MKGEDLISLHGLRRFRGHRFGFRARGRCRQTV